jgi:hypothetical protein
LVKALVASVIAGMAIGVAFVIGFATTSALQNNTFTPEAYSSVGLPTFVPDQTGDELNGDMSLLKCNDPAGC